MSKKVLASIAFMVAALQLSAQSTDSLPVTSYSNHPAAAASFFTIKGEEISRYPSTDFLDAVNGLFPWVFAQYPNPNNYLFIVNGNVLLDINAISLYDIEEITFDRNRINGDLYPIAKAGVFYIKTKKSTRSRPLVSFNTRYGTLWNKENGLYRPGNTLPTYYIPVSSEKNNSGGQLHSNHLSLAAGNDKFHLYTSAELQGTTTPKADEYAIFTVSNEPDTMIGSTHNRVLNSKAFLDLSYQFSDKLQAGITGSYFHGHITEDTSYFSAFRNEEVFQVSNAKNNLDYYHAGAYINWSPISHLHNSISLDYAGDRNIYDRVNLYHLTRTGPEINRTVLTRNKAISDQYYIRDRLSYELGANGKFRVTPAIAFSWLKQYLNYRNDYSFIENNQPTGAGYYFYYVTQKFTTLNPMVNFSWNNMISGYAGYATIISKAAKDITGSSKSNPYAGLSLDIKNMLKATGCLNRLDLSFDYGDITDDRGTNYWIASSFKMGSFAPASHFKAGFMYPGNKQHLFKTKMLALQLNSSFYNDRVQAGVAWSRRTQEDLFIQQVFIPSAPSFFYREGETREQGLSVYGAGKIIDQPLRQWDMRLSVLFPDTKYKIGTLTQGFIITNTNYDMQAALQQHFRFNKFSVQLNGLLGTGRQDMNYNLNITAKKATEVTLNYLAFGYDITGINHSLFQNFSVFVQARNLLTDKKTREYYRSDSYAGAGVNLSF